MPIKNKDLGKYIRPDIYINETDDSIVELPVQDTLINLVPGFSKKGPVNKPVYITNANDFVTIFGDIDRSLEKNGSYFHRTVLRMLNTGPVWALNLLRTDDVRDKIQWSSISTSSEYDNYGTDVLKTIPYSKVFNRQDFWERDDVSFQDYLEQQSSWSSNRLLQFTNLSDKYITVFAFKSNVSGFDITAEDWYGGRSKVPTFLNHTDWMSDYMISIIIVEGDWTNYNALSVDTTWGNYFNTNGLKKSTWTDFINEPNVVILNQYDVSLIPYFKDLSGRDMYIKSVINNNTDKTGLFCSYNEELLLSSDFPLPVLDIIGNGLVEKEDDHINFLSYNQSITEKVIIEEKQLNSPNNVFANYNTDLTSNWVGAYDRTIGNYTNGYVNDFIFSSVSSESFQILSSTSGNTLITDGGFPTGSDTGDVKIRFNKDFSTIDSTKYYYAYNASGNQFSLKDEDGVPVLNFTNQSLISNNIIVSFVKAEFTTSGSEPYYILGSKYEIPTGTQEIDILPLTISNTGATGLEKTNILYFSKGSQSVEVSDVNYIFTTNEVILGIVEHTYNSGTYNTTYTGVNVDSGGYKILDNSILTITGDTSSLILDFGGNGNNDYDQVRRDIIFDEIVKYVEDGAGQSKFVIINKNNGYKLPIGTSYNIVDYTITFYIDNPEDYYNGQEVLFFYVDDEFVISNSDTDRLITTDQPLEDLALSGSTGVYAAGIVAKHSILYQKYYDGEINNYDFVYLNNDTNSLDRIYLKMFIDNSGSLTIDFVDNFNSTDPQPIKNWTTSYNNTLEIVSQVGNLKQSVELENTTQYDDITNIRKIWVNKTRYSELTKGKFLEAYYDVNDLNLGEKPRKLTRIIKVENDSTNINWKIIYTDAPIKLTDTTDYQTYTYPSVDEYVNEYKGIKLKGFNISSDSIPNKTDERQSQILSVIDKSTKLAKALANKNKIQWRYLIDSFGLGLNSPAYGLGSKQQLADLCGMKLNCFGFINMPSVRDFKNSVNPSFIDQDGAIDIKLVAEGGDDTKNPNYLYEFAQGSVPASTVGYFFPYVRVSDNGIPTYVPPASYVATTYMQKFLGNFAGVQPWTIVAGVDYGRITGIGGVEMDLSDEDLTELTKMGANYIVNRENYGYIVNNESTAKIFPYSSLSLIHSREVLIELENRLYNMLLKYQWKFNTPEVRSEIKFKADQICSEFRDNNALYDFRNIIDETNNTDTIIDLQMGVLDTYVEIIKGMGIIVNNLTILRKGSIQSGGFINA